MATKLNKNRKQLRRFDRNALRSNDRWYKAYATWK